MTVYTTHEPLASPGRDAATAERIVFVKEGFSWPALLFAPIWLIWHRMWLVLLGYLILAAIIGYLPAVLGGASGWLDLAMLAFAFLFALEANQLRRWSLSRRKYREVGVVAGRDRDACERQFFAEWLKTQPLAQPRPTAGGPPGALAAPQQQREEIIGSFPQPGGR